MRVARWTAGGAFVAFAVLAVVAQFTGRPTPSWFGLVPAAIYVVLVVVQVVMQVARRSRGRRSRASDVVAPGLQGLGEVQDLYLGRPVGLTVSYGSSEPAAAGLVVPYTDPLDEHRWTLRPEPTERRSPTDRTAPTHD